MRNTDYFTCLDFLTDSELLPLQQLSLNFYSNVIPAYLNTVSLGTTHNKLFSYGIGSDELWVYHTQHRKWEQIFHTTFKVPKNRFGLHLNHSMQTVILQNEVLLMGGSEDENYNYLTDSVYCW